MIYSPKQLANSMLLIRQKNNWTQSELAKKVGLKQSTISNFENNPDNITLSTFFKMLQALDLNLELNEKYSSEVTKDDNNIEDW